MVMIPKSLEKRQNAGSSICQLVYKGLQQPGQLLCCDNNVCLANAPICSSTNLLAQCWYINGLDACKRVDALAMTVCQYQNGVYCLKGTTDQPYSSSNTPYSIALNLILSRNTVDTSKNGYTKNYDNPGPKLAANPFDNIICSDSMASGICQIQDDTGYTPFNYDVEVCNDSVDVINSPPQLASPITTITELITSTSTILSPPQTITETDIETSTITTTPPPPSPSLSNHLEVELLSSLPLVLLLVTSLGKLIGRKFKI
ncbi:hypothetical protein C1645_825706 [Glomus cerebriforme]|uniref:Uncharacterized protein n=1 Tax=Glomus cerebriforme TaxID=658196 RepID=A0A397SRM7_9GLOM|nr:hypothetical protein C1645_825706 [Glomus cerebriforme]